MSARNGGCCEAAAAPAPKLSHLSFPPQAALRGGPHHGLRLLVAGGAADHRGAPDPPLPALRRGWLRQ